MRRKLLKAMPDYEVLLHAAREIHELPEDAYVYPLGDIWAVELLPLIDGSEELRNIHSACMRAWIADHAFLDQRHLADVYSEAEHGGAWIVSRTDYWSVEIDRRIEEAAVEEENPNAQLLREIEGVLCCNAEADVLGDDVVDALAEAAGKLCEEFEPTRKDVSYWVPIWGAHYANVWGYYLAKAWRPDGDWRLLPKFGHTVVVNLEDSGVFDLVLGECPIADIRQQLNRAEALGGYGSARLRAHSGVLH